MTDSVAAVATQAPVASTPQPKKQVRRAVAKCSKCGKKFYGPRRNAKRGSHFYAAHTKHDTKAAASPAFGVAATLKVLEAQRDKLNRAIEVLKAI